MVFPRIVIDSTISSEMLCTLPDDVARSLLFLYLKRHFGEITESEFDYRAAEIVAGATTRIGVIRNIGG